MSPRARPEGCCPARSVDPLPQDLQGRMIAVFKALADPTRLEILRLLGAQSGPTCVCDIVDHFDRSQPTISHHLKVLREAHLLSQSKVGIWAFYAIDSRAQALLAQSEGLLGLSSGRNDPSAERPAKKPDAERPAKKPGEASESGATAS